MDEREKRELWKILAEVVRLWLPILVSICAIGLTIYQAHATRRHARLSVQPRVDWHIFVDAGKGILTLSLANDGLGPAILKDVALVVDGTALPTTSLEACADVNRRIGRDSAAWNTRCFARGPGQVLRAGDSLELFDSRPASERTEADPSGESVDYRRFAVQGRYCSLYEECWQIVRP